MNGAKILLAWLLLPIVVGAEIVNAPSASPDPAARYIIYLHGAIVTGSDGHPVSEHFGVYEYRAILERLAADGATLISEIRRDDADEAANVGRVIDWIAQLRKAGVPARQISVVGASFGGVIAARVSHALVDPEIRYVLVASTYRMQSTPPFALHGRVLVIHDEADERDWVERDYFAGSPDLGASRIVVTHTGRGHGLLYTPDDAWVIPTLAWVTAK